MLENVAKFLDELGRSVRDGTFVRMTLGNYKGSDEHLQKIHVRPVKTKKGARLFFLYRYTTRDTAKNFAADEVREILAKLLDGEFSSGHLFTTTGDLQLEIGKNGKSRLNAAKPTFKSVPPTQHDRKKKHQVDRHAFYLNALGITTDEGKVRDKQHDKWRQINKFVEILANLVDKSQLADKGELKVIDMGSGKGYLTFAAYDYFTNVHGIAAQITGVEARPHLVDLCNDIARGSGFEGLHFVSGTVEGFDPGDSDILIALHACNTATDEAIFKGIKAGAEIIIAVPCCHQEIRPQIKPPAMMKDILKHGVMIERMAETLTDGLRSLLLEREGYATRLFEFVAVEHTPKNNMLVGTRLSKSKDTDNIERQIAAIKAAYGIHEQRLEKLLS